MKYFTSLFFFLCAVLSFTCKEKPAEQTPAPPGTQTAPPASAPFVPFIPPADSSISPQRMKAWSGCNPLLDSLTFRYADSFKTEDPTAFMRYQEDFIAAQNKICVRAGLPGGYQEYKWILQHMGIEKNRAVLQSANAQTF
ncbi:MAG: hypothetical protein JXA18_12330 [Chitinispirillaceae bacterium]|nr:hypothetical protein [Chitinispirillaceae bacterium]